MSALICASGGTAYTTDLKSVGESLRVQIPPRAPATFIVAFPSFYDALSPLSVIVFWSIAVKIYTA